LSEGSVFVRADGRACAKYSDAKGQTRYLYAKTKPEVRRKLRQALRDRDEGIIPPSKMTVGVWLDEWLEDIRDDVSRRTWMTREGFVRNHIKPAIGTKKLSTLTPDDARRLYRQKSRQGLASSSVRRIHEILNQALRGAVRLKYISRNPLDDVKPPKASHGEMDVLTPKQVRRLLDTVRDQRWECVIVMGAVCGLRVGEALSLRYEDLDLTVGTVRVSRTLWKGQVYPPKTPSSRRTLKLPRIALEALTRHCEANGNPSEGWCFPTKNGNPTTPESFWLWGWKRTLRKAGLPESLTYHQLRHGTASLLLNQGVPLPIVSHYLGHANPGITARVYAHLIDGTSGMAATGMDEALG
jgi:integrase